MSLKLSAIEVVGCEADEGGDLLAIDLAELRQHGEERIGEDRADPRHPSACSFPDIRREFIAALGSAAAWPLMARAQQSERMRRIGMLMPAVADRAEQQARVTAFRQGLQQLGWTDGRNVRIDTRWAAGNPDDARKYAAELVALAPDVVLASGSRL